MPSFEVRGLSELDYSLFASSDIQQGLKLLVNPHTPVNCSRGRPIVTETSETTAPAAGCAWSPSCVSHATQPQQ